MISRQGSPAAPVGGTKYDVVVSVGLGDGLVHSVDIVSTGSATAHRSGQDYPASSEQGVEQFIVAAGVADHRTARLIRASVMSAYEVGTRHASAVPILQPSTVGAAEFAGTDPFLHPEVQRYLADTSAELRRLQTSLDNASSHPEERNVLGERAELLRRVEFLQELVIDQAASMEALHAAMNRVRALRDLASWAAYDGGSDARASIQLSDLERALEGAPSDRIE